MFLNACLLLVCKPASSQKVFPGRVFMSGVGYLIGGVCGMLGIGGSVFVIPYLNYYNVDMHVSVLISVAVGLIISSVSVVVYVFNGFACARFAT